MSLERSEDRRVHTRRQLDALWSGSWEMLDAVDGGLLDFERFRSGGLLNEASWLRRPLRTGEIGCWLSHAFALQRALGDAAPTTIFEDDVHLAPAFVAPASSRLAQLEATGASWDVCFWGWGEGQAEWRPQRPTELLPGGFFRMDEATKGAPGSFAYSVTRRGARRLLTRLFERPIDVPFDEVFVELCTQDLSVYCAAPGLAEPADFPSLICSADQGPAASQEVTEAVLNVYLACVSHHGSGRWATETTHRFGRNPS